MLYDSIPSALQGLVCILGVLMLWGTAALLIQISLQKAWHLLLPALPLALLTGFFLRGTGFLRRECSCGDVISVWVARRPWWMPILAALLIAACMAALYSAVRRWSAAHLSEKSVKDGIDNLPVGICWFGADGSVFLKNSAMEQLCRSMTQEPLLNGVCFCERAEALKSGDGLLHVKDGRVWKITLRENTVRKFNLSELTALDVTAEYAHTQLLLEEQAELQETNERLNVYLQQLLQSITSCEVLAAKVKIHDDLGLALISARRYVSSGGTPEDKQQLLEALHRSVNLLGDSAPVPEQDEYRVLLAAAANVSMKIQVTGTLPQWEPCKHVVAAALHECLTNTLRHAQGDTVFVTIQESLGRLEAVFTNNGMQPEAEIVPKGGLLSLYSLAKQAEAEMRMESLPVFRLILSFEVTKG